MLMIERTGHAMIQVIMIRKQDVSDHRTLVLVVKLSTFLINIHWISNFPDEYEQSKREFLTCTSRHGRVEIMRRDLDAIYATRYLTKHLRAHLSWLHYVHEQLNSNTILQQFEY
jgi:hypothetical protein